ncbi:hypothetical protein BDP55DRAFT_103243 [Colletotrichum godetiae]|uniref:GATA-type domain-containing protein n=1 Tax=Colletotrichum godetiae TaxID=1209918 RepID=A0AAJ0EZA5_9PEZI|nr:uncharacterized protein BDP55DRAFT_103243 [Colletotrichum godetiae]KAK1676944.1 hypothetical protein BDP55DRAFT_103243 [Colletotrichum godetiae]
MARTPADLATPLPALTSRRRLSEHECSHEPLAPMSLNHLKASEIIQRVHGDANNLLRNIQSLLRYSRVPDSATTHDGGRHVPSVLLGNPKLLHAQKISQHITGDMAELVAISQKSKEAALRVRRPNHLRKIRRKQHGAAEHTMDHQTNDSMSDPFVCHNCHTTFTPQWRSGPAGPHTLCNVCGLIHAMRQRKQGLRHSNRVSASSSLSFSS